MSGNTETQARLQTIAQRIRELRDISGFTVEEMAAHTDLTPEEYRALESGTQDLPFTFLHKCALTFGVEMTEILEGTSARLTGYTVTRAGEGELTAREEGIEITSLAPMFRGKLIEPYRVLYTYSKDLQTQPIHLTTHSGHEFDLVLSGMLKVQVGTHTEILCPGDSIYYDSSKPHGMIAIGGEDCLFCAVVVSGDAKEAGQYHEAMRPEVTAVTGAAVPAEQKQADEPRVWQEFIAVEEDEHGTPRELRFHDTARFNFAFDVVDALARRKPDKLAMIHVDREHNERYFTFRDLSRYSARAANYFRSLGIERGDRVLLVLKRHYQFWIAILGLHKLGAVAIPATSQLLAKDFEYRFNAAGVKAVLCTADGSVAGEVDAVVEQCPTLETRILVGGTRPGWRDFDSEFRLYSEEFIRQSGTDAPGGDDPMLMLFTSGTTGYPKIAAHSYKYPLGHFLTAKYWHCVDPDGLHLTISETGWGKALWGKLYGQWLCEAAIFVYDFDRFHAEDILPMFAKYQITTFCAPPTMYRMLIKEDLSQYDLSSVQRATIAGEALNPEVFQQFQKATGLAPMEGFGQTETALTVATLVGMEPKPGSMGKPTCAFDVDIVDADGNSVDDGVTGEIVVRTDLCVPCGLFAGYYRNDEATHAAWHDGLYHTGDTAWRDEDGYFWYVGRVDDLIKSSGYRIGPFEIESVLMELPYILECGVSAAPDPVRGQVVKASIVLTKGTEGTDALKKEIQDYVKHRTAPYKYPRIIVFRESLPKTTSGKIIRAQL